jgi:DNA-binding Lrp family transcriptional regulator
MVVAYSLIKAESEKDHEVFFALSSRNEVKEVALAYGIYNLIAKIEVESPEALEVFIFNVLRKIPEVKDTTTLIASRIAAGAGLG